MQHIMTDVLVQDPLSPNAKPLYEVEGDHKIIYLIRDEYGDVDYRRFISPPEQPATRIQLPMIALEQPWKNSSWKHKTPQDLQRMTSLLLVAGGIITDNQYLTSSAEDAFEYANNWYLSREMFPGHVAGNYDTLSTHLSLIEKYGLHRRDVQIDAKANQWTHCFDGELIFFPEPEYLGALAIEHGDAKVGMFLALNNVLRVITQR